MSIITMIVPFVLTGLVLTAAALAWAYRKQNDPNSGPPVSEPEPGGEP